MSRTSTLAQPMLPELTPDETRILQECDRESLIYRSLPMSAVMFFGIQYAMMKNMISTKSKWLKIGCGVFAGLTIGKFSYAMECQKKILAQIPDSNLAQMIRGVATTDTNDGQTQHTNDLNRTDMFVPDSQTTPVGINQYGDPIYETNK